MKKYLIIPILIIAAFFLFKDINRPFFGLHENNSVMFSMYAKDVFNKGLFETKFCGTAYIGHPCLVQIMLTGFYKVLGFNDVVGRLFPIVFSLGSLILVLLIGKKLFGETVGLLSLLIMSFLPSFVTFGDMISHEMILIFFALLGIYYLIENRFFMSVGSLILASLIDWPGFYLWGIFLVLLIWQKRKKDALVLIGVGVLTVVALVVHLSWVNGWDLSGAIKTYQRLFLNRSGAIDGGLSALFSKVYFREKLLFTPIIILMSIIGFVCAYFLKRKSFPFLAMLFIFAAMHVLIFRSGWFQHFYWSYYFIPFLAISSAYFLSFLYEKIPFKLVGFLLVCIFLIYYVKTSLRNITYFDSLYDKNLEVGIEKLNNQLTNHKVYLVTSQYGSLALQYYLKGQRVSREKADYAVAWILPDVTTQEQKNLIDICQKYSCKTVTEPGNYPMFKVAKLK